MKVSKIISVVLLLTLVTSLVAIPANAALIVDNGTVAATGNTAKTERDDNFGNVEKISKFGASDIYNMYFTGKSYKSPSASTGPYRMFVSKDFSPINHSTLSNNYFVATSYIALDEANYKNAVFNKTNAPGFHIGLMSDSKSWAGGYQFGDLSVFADLKYIYTDRLAKLDCVYSIDPDDAQKVLVYFYFNNRLNSKRSISYNGKTSFKEFVISMQSTYGYTPEKINIYEGDIFCRTVEAGDEVYQPDNGTGNLTANGLLRDYAPNFVPGSNFFVPDNATVSDVLEMSSTYKVFELRSENGTVITKNSGSDILSKSAVGYYIYAVGNNNNSDDKGLYSKICAEKIEFADYYTDPGLITDKKFFGVWSGTDWTTKPMLNYTEYPGLSPVKNAVVSGDYTTAKSELLRYYKDKCSDFLLSSKAEGNTKQYIDYLMYKNNMLNSTIAGVKAKNVLTADDEWNWLEADITDIFTASDFHSNEKTYSFILTALNKDNSVIEIKSSEYGQNCEPVVEAVVNGKTVSFKAVEDAYISAGTNTNKTFGSLDKNVLKVAESSTSIGKLDDPVDENTYRAYLKFDFDSIAKGNKVTKAVLKVYARNAGETGKKDMILFSSGENAWQESTISWGCGDITHNMYSFDGDPMPGWDMTKAAYANARIVTNPIRFEDTAFGVLGHYQTYGNEEIMYHLIRMLISYVTMKPDPAFNNNLSTAQRTYGFARLISYAVQSPMMTPDVFAGFLKYFKISGDYLQSDEGFNSNNNWGVYQSAALLGLSWMYDEIITSPAWESTALDRLSFMAGNVNMADGASVESAVDYSTQSLGLFTNRLSSIVRIVGKDKSELGFSDGFRNELYKQAKFIMDTTGPGVVAPQWGDDNSYTTNYKSDLLTTGNLVGAEDLLWTGSDGSKGTEPDYKSVLYPVKGMAVMRSDWSKNALWLHINNDKARTSHGHADDLSVIVFANGRYLLADPLIYLYNPTDNPIRQWLLGTNGHNTVMINNGTQKMSNKDSDPGLVSDWETNEAFDYVKMMTEAYEGFKHTRNVMFVKNKFWIINDLLEPDNKTTKNQYEQLWHFLPDADISVDSVSMETRTNFGDGDIKVIPVDTQDYAPVKNFTIEGYKSSGGKDSYKQDSTSSGIKVGYYSAKYGAVTDAEYSSYRKVNVAGDTTFNTILFPVTTTDDYDVEATALKTGKASTEASALKLTYSHKKTKAKSTGIFYNLLDEQSKGECTADIYSTDGQTMYVENEDGVLSSAILRDGTHIKDTSGDVELIKSLGNIGAISVKWQSGDIYIESMNELKLDDITIYNGGVQTDNVYLNGVAINENEFKTEGRYVYFGKSPIIPDKKETLLTKNESEKSFRASGVSDGNAVFVVAEYDSTGKKLTKILSMTEFSEEGDFDKTYILENYDETKRYKAFLWQLPCMKPLTGYFQEMGK